MHSSRMLREGARPQILRDKMGHVDIRRDPFCLQQELCEEPVDKFAAYRKSGVLLHMHGNATNQALSVGSPAISCLAFRQWRSNGV
jgi:hypothetical protein